MQKNLEVLRGIGATIIKPEYGQQACGDVGVGRMAAIDKIVDCVRALDVPKFLKEKNIDNCLRNN